MPQASPPIHDVAHLGLRLGRLMLLNGADTAHVQDAVVGFARQFGFQAHLLVHAEGLLLTLEDAGGFRTKIGTPVTGLAVNMDALIAVERLRAPAGMTMPEIERLLDAVEHGPRRYPAGWWCSAWASRRRRWPGCSARAGRSLPSPCWSAS
jgi:uncharacterized membrane protein YjjP (DUF1212 family)